MVSSGTRAVLSLGLVPCLATAFLLPAVPGHLRPPSTARFGYLDDLSKELYAPDSSSTREDIDTQKMNMKKEEVDRYGVGSWEDYVEFNEFDGGDGQMGVAGDGQKGLEKEWQGAAQMGKSKVMSAKNAWGKSTGYADTLIDAGMEATRAQQLENWQNQQEVRNARLQHRYMTDVFDQASTSTADEDWRQLSKYGAERNEKFDLDEAFGPVIPGSKIYHHIELTSRIGQPQVVEFDITNSFMGYSDFRARFTPETGDDWSVEPTEGSLNGRKGTDFVVKYRPQNPGVSSGYLVIQTEDDKWTFQVTGTASM